MTANWGVGLLLLAGCGGVQGAKGQSVAAAPTSSATPSESAAPPPRPSRPPCEVLLELTAPARETFPKPHVALDAAPCLQGKGGAYSLIRTYAGEATNAEGYGGGYFAHLTLLHAKASGEVARSKQMSIEESALASQRWTLEGLADFDADGVDELLVHTTDWEFEANGSESSDIWRVRGDLVEQYPAAKSIPIQRFNDFDGDGLLDLEVAKLFQGTINGCGPDGEWIEFGPTIVAHAVAGRFDYDEVSQREAKQLCPVAPQTIVPRVQGGIENTELRRRVACAVMWGVPRIAIVKQLEQRCPTPAPPSTEPWLHCDYEGVHPECINLPQLLLWAAVKPPFVLR